MNTNDIIRNAGNVTVSINIDDLRLILREAIEDSKRELEEAVISEKMETYPTPKQVCQILNIAPTTLWRWGKKNILVPLEIGGQRKYRMSDVKALLRGGK